MAKKSLGYVRLEWTCPSCQTRNPGTQRVCSNCGTPQPDNLEFEQAAQEELITDEAEIARAKAGPDVHCYYCGTRNPGDAERCSQCGADLSEGATRKYGHIVGAHRDKAAEPLICSSCGTPNDPDEPTCASCGASIAAPKIAVPQSQPVPAQRPNMAMFAIIAVVLLVICALFFMLSASGPDTAPAAPAAPRSAPPAATAAPLFATVEDVGWQREIEIEGLVPVQREAWLDEIPSDAEIGTCRLEFHHVQDEPAPDSEELCGTPYTVDTGTGLGEVVQDCQYHVYEDVCTFDVFEWQVVDRVTETGQGLTPDTPTLALSENQRFGRQDALYQVIFQTEDGLQTYTTRNPNEISQFQPGSQWNLQMNNFDEIMSIAPASQ